VNKVKRSFIRVEADELTYPLHVILRYEIERDIVGGKMDVADLPRVWKERMRELLGVEVEDDANGCLQDVHWSGLAIG
jgi:carboxypeptidase Taq